MTVGQIEEQMSSRELAEWMAYARYYQPLDGSWEQAGLIASAVLAPYSRRGRTPKASDFIPVEPAPQHKTQIRSALSMLKRDLEAMR